MSIVEGVIMGRQNIVPNNGPCEREGANEGGNGAGDTCLTTATSALRGLEPERVHLLLKRKESRSGTNFNKKYLTLSLQAKQIIIKEN